MGRINKYSKGNKVNHDREIQGKFLEKQDIESHLLSKKLNKGNNIQKKNTPNIDDLPNIPAILDYALNIPKKNSIEPINGAIPHTPMGALLPILTLLSAIPPNSTALSNKAISTDTPNGLLSGVTSATPVSKTAVLFGTTTSTSQNHAQSKKLTKHSDDQSLIREKRAVGDGLIQGNANSKVILGNDGQKLTFSRHLDIDILKEQLENSNITKLSLWGVKINPKKAQDIGKILKDSKVEVLSILHSNIGNTGAINFGTMLTGTKVTTLNLAYNGIGDKKATGIIKSLKKASTKVKAVNLKGNNISDTGVSNLILELKGTKITEMGLDKGNIKSATLKKLLKALEDNKHVKEESYTSTIESSTTEGEFPHTSSKREKRDIHTTSSTEDTTVLKEEPTTTVKSTVPTTDVSSTTATESTAAYTSTTAKKEPTTPTTVSTTTKSVTTSSTEGLTTTEQETTVPTTLKSSTSTTESTPPTTVSTSTTEPTTNVKSSTTTTKSTAFSAGKTTTLKEELTTLKEELTTLKEELTTPKKNLTEKPEPIAADVVVDSITEKHTPKESNPNNPASSTMSIGEISGLISSIVTIIGVGGGVAIYAIKKLCGGASRLGHNALALADLALAESDDRLDNNEETSSLTGVIVDDNADI